MADDLTYNQKFPSNCPAVVLYIAHTLSDTLSSAKRVFDNLSNKGDIELATW